MFSSLRKTLKGNKREDTSSVSSTCMQVLTSSDAVCFLRPLCVLLSSSFRWRVLFFDACLLLVLFARTIAYCITLFRENTESTDTKSMMRIKGIP